MVVLALIAIIGAIAYPRITDGLRKMRAREGAKGVVNAILNARAQSMIRNVAHRVTLTTSTTPGAKVAGSGGTILTERSSAASCTAGGLSFTAVEQYDYAPLGDITLCRVQTTATLVDATVPCQATTVQLCVTPDGRISNLTTPTANFTLVYIREFQDASTSPTPTGVDRQVVIPQRKAVQVNPIQVTNDACL
jgi:hypothetical protein